MSYPAIIPEIERLILLLEDKMKKRHRLIEDTIDLHRVLCEARIVILEKLDGPISNNHVIGKIQNASDKTS